MHCFFNSNHMNRATGLRSNVSKSVLCSFGWNDRVWQRYNIAGWYSILLYFIYKLITCLDLYVYVSVCVCVCLYSPGPAWTPTPVDAALLSQVSYLSIYTADHMLTLFLLSPVSSRLIGCLLCTYVGTHIHTYVHTYVHTCVCCLLVVSQMMDA